jgi:predicted P-loop ATPase
MNNALSFISELVPGGRQIGHEYVAASIGGGEGRSFSVNLNTGIYTDFSDPGSGGPDLVSLFARVRGMNNGQAATELMKRYGSGMPTERPTRANKNRLAIIVPDGVRPPLNFDHPTHGQAVRTWRYATADGKTIMFIARYDTPGGKQFCPFTFDGKRWNKYGWADPQPLYGLDDMALPGRQLLTIIIVEGEKAADAARKFAPGQVVLTWPGGANRWHKADWAPVYGRKIVLWPDNDDPGHTCMYGLASALASHCPEIKIFNVKDMPAGWDAADALAAGWTSKDFAKWATAHISNVPDRDQIIIPPNGHAPERPPVEPIAPHTAHIEIARPNGHARNVDARILHMEFRLTMDGGNKPHPNVGNVSLVLSRDPQMEGIVWYDEFQRKFFTDRDGGGGPGKIREWEDVDDTRLQYYFQQQLEIPKMGLDSVRQAVREFAKRHPRHCVRDWINGLTWDGRSRIDGIFTEHFGADDSEYIQAVSRTFILSMLARLFRPGAKVDTMVVLEGEQGIRKSLGLETIATTPLYTTQHESIQSKAFFEVLQGKLLIEIGEMDAFSRADITRVKDVVSSATDRFREPYAHHAADHPRQCVFAGTTNRYDWNKDDTGARRFNPVRCRGRVDLDALERDRDQYFAEGRVRLAPDTPWDPQKRHFSGGEDWWTTPDGETAAQQRARYQEDPWQEFVERYINYELVSGSSEFQKRLAPLTQVTVNEILTGPLRVEIPRIQRADQLRVASSLRHMGWYECKGEIGDGQYGKVWKVRRDE